MAALMPLIALLAAIVPLGSTAVRASHTERTLTSVTLAGSLGDQIAGCSTWQPDCAAAHLTEIGNGVWRGQFPIKAGSWEYKLVINDNWSESYAGNHIANGNTTLTLAADSVVRFYYDDKTHAVLDSAMDKIATAAGSFQSELGCPGDWQPACVRTLLTDPDGNGVYTFSTTDIPAGSYEFKVARDEAWDVSYPGSNFPLVVGAAGEKVTINWNSATNEVTLGDLVGNITLARAHWLTRDTIAWNVAGDPANSYRLHYDPNGALTLDPAGVQGGQALTLTYDPAGLSAALKAAFPHLAAYKVFKLSAADLASVPTLLKGQLAVSAVDSAGKLIDATSLQLPGVLDDLYSYSGDLGVVYRRVPDGYSGIVPTLSVWAPTARSVKLHLFDKSSSPTATILPMTGNAQTGVWSISGRPEWSGKYYLYEVEVFVRATGKVERNLVTDPYSISLSMNSARSQIVNLDAPSLKPYGWDNLRKPELKAPEDIVLYELHVRDFSISDPTVSAKNRGKFTAFAERNSNGMKHLRALAQAGLTHIHLLPVFDIATINENPAERREPDPAVLASFAPDSQEQAAYLAQFQATDAFNWGYDPFHYTTPEGSYSTDPDGVARIREFRQMVKGLSDSGLRVVMDVVYNHTNASGQDEKSVLDRIVPGYYHRLNEVGGVETSTCCQNTATEHAMMEKLMIDSVATWAKQYKVDAFRFDLMGHHSKANLLKLQERLHSLTLARDGVDGSKIYIYGEGWNFGEVANNARFEQATQLNMAGTGIGTFSDRLRDAVRGGGPFDNGENLRIQGFINGLYYDPNALPQGGPAAQLERLLLYQDQIRVGNAGNLRDYLFTDRTGAQVKGSQVDYNGSPSGYTLDPQDVITYIEAHDNQTLFDVIQYKTPISTSLADRVRIQNLGNAIVMLSQGVPFFHAGQDMLRSKSLDRNSYDSGDWFNRLDFSYQTNNWGVGVPPIESEADVAIMKELLGNPALKPTSANILSAVNYFRDLLRIRKSSPLFRLQTAAEIEARVKMYNTGPNQLPGLLVMSIADQAGANLDPNYRQIVVLFNANDSAQTFSEAALAGLNLRLHPVQASGSDAVVKTASYNATTGVFTIPARTTAVFVLPER
jgi:pullulanase-type alpha-1,6-glucosidase